MSVFPARASLTYYNGSSGSTLYTNAISAASLTPSALETFVVGGLNGAHSAYLDSATAIDFFSLKSDGVTADTFFIFGTNLEQNHANNIFQITLPASVYAFETTLTFTAATFANVCFQAGGSSFNSGCSGNQNVTWVSAGTNEFLGIVSDTPFNTVWIGPIAGNPTLEVVSFSDATGAANPEVRSMAMLGTGLLLLGFLRRWWRPAESCPQS